MSEIQAGSGERAVLGIHTNTEPGAPLVDGHAWLTLTRGGRTEAYGLWPASHPRFSGENSPPPTDVRRGIEIGFEATASRYYELTPDQLRTFEAAAREKVTWGYTNTCASWASGTTYRVTGERVNASELGGLTDTPRQLRDSIDLLERRQNTTRDAPRKPEEARPAKGSSSSALSTADPGDREVRQLLSVVGDPERMALAMDGLRASARGQAFAAQAAAPAATLAAGPAAHAGRESADGMTLERD